MICDEVKAATVLLRACPVTYRLIAWLPVRLVCFFLIDFLGALPSRVYCPPPSPVRGGGEETLRWEKTAMAEDAFCQDGGSSGQ